MIYNHRNGLGFPNDSQNEKIVIFVYSPMDSPNDGTSGKMENHRILRSSWSFDGFSCHSFAKCSTQTKNPRRSDNISIFSSRKSPCSFGQKNIFRVKIRIFSTQNTTLGIKGIKGLQRPKNAKARTLRKRHDEAMRICCFGCFTSCGPWVEHKVFTTENHGYAISDTCQKTAGYKIFRYSLPCSSIWDQKIMTFINR